MPKQSTTNPAPLTIDDVFSKLQDMERAAALRDDDLTVARVRTRFPDWPVRKCRAHLDALVAQGVLQLLPAPQKSGRGSKQIWRITIPQGVSHVQSAIVSG